MTWVATGVSAGGAVVSAVGAGKAGKEASRKAASQEQMLRQDMAERTRIARRQEGLWSPIEDKLQSQALATGIDPLRAGIVRQTVGTEFNNADRNIQRIIGTRGVSSGLAASMMGGSQMNRARAMATGMLGEYQNKDQLRMGLLSRYNPLAMGEYQSQGLRGMAAHYGDQASRAYAAEQQGWQGAAQGVMNAGMAYARSNNPKPPSSVDIKHSGLPSSESLSPIQPRSTIDSNLFTPGVVPSYGPITGGYTGADSFSNRNSIWGPVGSGNYTNYLGGRP